MRGKVHLMSESSHLGKILLDDGRESRIIKFPDTFDTDDIVEVTFQRDDPLKPVIRMEVVGGEWYYGMVMVINREKPFGSILPTYPEIKPLAFFHTNNFPKSIPLKYGSQVKFHLRKQMDGKVSAVDIQAVSSSDRYKASIPVFGTIEKRLVRPQSGIVFQVVKSKKQHHLTGVVKFAKENPQGSLFGFISRDDGGDDIYFFGEKFMQAYERRPQKGDRVAFTVSEYRGRTQVGKFVDSRREELLPPHEQYGVIQPVDESEKSHRFRLDAYRKLFQREPVEGDIVYYRMENDKIFFLQDGETVQERYLFHIGTPAEKRSDEKLLRARIKYFDPNRKFGFVKTEEGDAYFTLYTYRRSFKSGEPSVGDSVEIVIEKASDGRSSVKRFHRQKGALQCRPESFQNFVDVYEEGELFYGYAQGDRMVEVRKFDPTRLSEVISAYRNRSLPREQRVRIIDALIAFGYENKKISTANLKQERLKILDELVGESLKRGETEVALSWEIVRQKHQWSSERLKRFDVKRLYSEEIPLHATQIKPSLATEHPWSIMEIASSPAVRMEENRPAIMLLEREIAEVSLPQGGNVAWRLIEEDISIDAIDIWE